MSYKITFRDQTWKVLSTDRGNLLKVTLMGMNPPQILEIDGELHRRADILSVKLHTQPGDYMPEQSSLLPEKADHCKGQFSIQNEINKIAKTHRNWPLFIQNSKWRAKVRLELLALPESKWCDYKTNTCVCHA